MMRTLTLLVLTCGVASAQPVAQPAVGRVIKVEVSGDTTLATVGLGSDQGVTKTSTCRFQNNDGKPLAADCVLIRVDKRTTIVKTNLTVEQIHSTPLVQLTLH